MMPIRPFVYCMRDPNCTVLKTSNNFYGIQYNVKYQDST